MVCQELMLVLTIVMFPRERQKESAGWIWLVAILVCLCTLTFISIQKIKSIVLVLRVLAKLEIKASVDIVLATMIEVCIILLLICGASSLWIRMNWRQWVLGLAQKENIPGLKNFFDIYKKI